jgi:hypothetical protein
MYSHPELTPADRALRESACAAEAGAHRERMAHLHTARTRSRRAVRHPAPAWWSLVMRSLG